MYNLLFVPAILQLTKVSLNPNCGSFIGVLAVFDEILLNKTYILWNFHFISLYTNTFYLLCGGHVEFSQPFYFS